MSTTTADSTTVAPTQEPAAASIHPPSDSKYFVIAAILCGLTAIEIALPLIFEGSGKIYGPMLIVLMAIKFWTVAAYFMHLKGDSKLFTMAFYAGIVMALAVYLVTLGSMNFFQDSGKPYFDDPSPALTTMPPATK